MREVELTFEIRCLDVSKFPAYRIYVDGDLITERSFIWEGVILKEHIYVMLEVGNHEVKLEELFDSDSPQQKIFMTRVRIDDVVVGDADNVFYVN